MKGRRNGIKGERRNTGKQNFENSKKINKYKTIIFIIVCGLCIYYYCYLFEVIPIKVIKTTREMMVLNFGKCHLNEKKKMQKKKIK